MPRARTRRRGKTFVSPEIMIAERPTEAADRAVPGHRRDILGWGSSAIGTHVERTTRSRCCYIFPAMPGTASHRARTGPLFEAARSAEAPGGMLQETWEVGGTTEKISGEQMPLTLWITVRLTPDYWQSRQQ